MRLPQKLGGRQLALLLVTVIVMPLLLWLVRPERTVALRPLPPLPVAVIEVRQVDLAPSFRATGRLRSARQAQLHFPLAGVVAERRVEPGGRVAAGTVLLTMERGDYEDALITAEALLTQERSAIERDRRLLQLARESSELQQAEVKRLTRLGSESLASRSLQGEAQQRLGTLLAEQARLSQSVASAASRIALRQADLNRATRNLERTQLTAPFDGIVNRVEAERGDYVAPNQPVVTLVSQGELDLYLEVPGRVTSALFAGMPLTIEQADSAFSGTLIALQRDPDAKTHTHALRVRLVSEVLRPGELAEVELPLPRRSAVPVVPVTALLYEEGHSYLFRVVDGQLERVEVTTGVRDDELREVAGIAVGSTVVSRGVAALADGQQVVATPAAR